MKKLICVECGKEFEHDRKKQFCTKDCQDINLRRRKFGVRQCELCKAHYIPKREESRFCSEACTLDYGRLIQGRPPVEETPCPVCGKTFKPVTHHKGERHKHCSPECRALAPWIGRSCRIYFIACCCCEKKFTSKTKGRKYCSKCKKENKYWVVRYRGSEKYKGKTNEGICKECGKYFVNEYGEKRQSFCDDKCAKKYGGRIGKSARRARIKGRKYEMINPLEIFTKAGWKCRQCEAETPRRLRGTCDDRAPELDHIIPIACGGSHTKDNVQLLCRKCNQDKGATIKATLSV